MLVLAHCTVGSPCVRWYPGKHTSTSLRGTICSVKHPAANIQVCCRGRMRGNANEKAGGEADPVSVVMKKAVILRELRAGSALMMHQITEAQKIVKGAKLHLVKAIQISETLLTKRNDGHAQTPSREALPIASSATHREEVTPAAATVAVVSTEPAAEQHEQGMPNVTQEPESQTKAVADATVSMPAQGTPAQAVGKEPAVSSPVKMGCVSSKSVQEQKHDINSGSSSQIEQEAKAKAEAEANAEAEAKKKVWGKVGLMRGEVTGSKGCADASV